MAGTYPNFLSMKDAKDRMLVHPRVPPPPSTQQYIARTHLYTWVSRYKVE